MKYSTDEFKQIFREKLISIYHLTEINSFIDIVFEDVLQFSKIDVMMRKNALVSEEKTKKILIILERLKKHEPIQYILGNTFFFDMEFFVEPNVLIPRPETEELVDKIIKDNPNKTNLRVLDIGTGSGCIAISLSKHLNNSEVHAYDISKEALSIAQKNADKNSVDVNFELKDIRNCYNNSELNKFDIIVSNPPYVTNKEAILMDKNVLDYEPRVALFVPDDKPLFFYELICYYAKLNLKEGGRLYFEINEAYGKQISDLLQSFHFKNINLIKDIGGKDRIVSATLKNN